jgi:bifunctional non-homologous end joining protein LigD
MVHEHHARTHHFDLRLESGGVFKSWAVPKGIPAEAGVCRLALEVEDHDLEFGNFEGEIPAGEYGAGTIKIWDRGDYSPVEWSEGRIVFNARGRLMNGRFSLVRFRRGGPREWLLTKGRD